MNNKRTIKKILDYGLTAVVVIFIISLIFVPLRYFSMYGTLLIKIAIFLFITTLLMNLFYFAKDSDKRRWRERKKDDRRIFGIKRKIFFSILEWGGLLLLVFIIFNIREGKIGKTNCPDAISGNVDANFKIKYFYSPFCTYCWLQEPILRDMLQLHGDSFSLERYDIRYCKSEVARYKVSGTPSFVFVLKNESKEFVSYGFIPKDKFESILENYEVSE